MAPASRPVALAEGGLIGGASLTIDGPASKAPIRTAKVAELVHCAEVFAMAIGAAPPDLPKARKLTRAEGAIHDVDVSPIGVTLGADGMLTALEDLSTPEAARCFDHQG
jgi:hypothetical protein